LREREGGREGGREKEGEGGRAWGAWVGVGEERGWGGGGAFKPWAA